jgi:hypothetical protein
MRYAVTDEFMKKSLSLHAYVFGKMLTRNGLRQSRNMTNHDFWMSVSGIINEGYTSKGLAKLDEYAEQISLGKILCKRFSSSEQYGCCQGGAIHVVASLLAGAEVSPNQFSAPEGSFKREQQLAKVQEGRIESWARAAGVWIPNTDKTYQQSLGDEIAQGGEAVVYDNGNKVLKSIGLDYFVQPILALDRISLHNAYFEETAMKVLGFGRNSNHDFVVVVEQPFVQGTMMDDARIAEFATRMGFELINPHNWTFATKDIYLSDLHDENVLLSPNGHVCVIDCDIRINTPELRAGGTRTLTNEVKFTDSRA